MITHSINNCPLLDDLAQKLCESLYTMLRILLRVVPINNRRGKTVSPRSMGDIPIYVVRELV